MQTKWAELFCPLREVTPLLLLFFLSSSPPSRSDRPCRFLPRQSACLLLMGAQSFCLLQSRVPADTQLTTAPSALLMLLLPPLLFYSFWVTSLEPPAQYAQKRKRNAQEQTHSHTLKYTGGTAKYD